MSGAAGFVIFWLAARLASPVAAEEKAVSPNGSEKGWAANCVKEKSDESAAFSACVGKVTEACLGLEDAPKEIKPSDKNGHPRSCAAVEAKIWDDYLNRWYGDAAKIVPAEAKEKLRDAQRAWIAYRAARCDVESALHPFPLGEDNRADCLMRETARRALQLRAIATDMY
ncbi:lysozyme inhibitor LprI family protein [Methylocystis sp. JAN1]|uniref:lysozyme inhibitor LprI family protein n=1 Tax=Methylocystis sp. JAN1 TaxID=3397211 RepID=UPI003FA226F2